MILNSPTISGSLTVTGNILTSGSITLSGSVASASYAATASFVALAQSASNAVSAATASFANAFTVAGNLTAQTLVVQTITSSVDFVTGSTRFGSLLSNTHVFSGSVTMNPGGLFVSSSGNVGIGTTTQGTRLEISSRAADADRTIPHNVLTITAEQGNAPYGFFGGAILFKNRSYTSGLVESSRIRSVIYDDGAPNNFGGGLWFETTPTPGGAFTSSVAINYQGRVGIGTTIPRGVLDVRVASDRGITVTGTVSNETIISGMQGDVSANLRNLRIAASNLFFNIGDGTNSTGTQAMTITSGGNVGIGTTNIGTEANLHLGAFGANEGGQLILQRGTSYASASHLDNYQNRFRIMSGNDTTSSAERLSVDMTNGNVVANGSVSAASFSTFSTSTSIPFTTWTTFYTTDASTGGIYIVQAGLNSSSTADWAASAIFYSAANSDMNYLVGPVNGNLVQLRKTGNSIQVYQNGTSPSVTMQFRILKVQ